MNRDSFWTQRVASFGYAIQGVVTLFRTQIHAWVHLAATIVVVIAGWLLGVSAVEWAVLFLASGLVWVSEAANTAIEFTVDLASPDHDSLAGKAKDVAAASVLLAACTAVAVAG